MLAMGACSLIWGTTWFAITQQFGPVPALVSVAYRFGISAALIFAFCLITRQSIVLRPRQHLAALGQGVSTFAINYPLVYLAEEKVPSGVVAVTFAALAFVNLVVFRLAFGTRASWSSWAGAALGVAGVAVMSFSQLIGAHMDPKTATGLLFGVLAVLMAAVGNVFAHRGHAAGTEVAPGTAWSMAYGAAALAIFDFATGKPFIFDPRPAYGLSLIYLSLFGSVIAFLLYFALARRRSYTFASYISAITPPIALGISAVFEHAPLGWGAAAGVVLVVIGQALLIRSPKAG